MTSLTVAECSSRGGRELNEDHLGFCANDSVGCFVLADGTGGYRGGAQAARSVVQSVLSAFSDAPRVDRERVEDLLDAARAALAEERRRHPQYGSMNTTLATLVVDAGASVAYWCHLGDSRIYLFRHGRARRLTQDHSVLQAMIDAGFVTGCARGNRDRNTLYASVGCDEIPARAVCDNPIQVRDGDRFLLCSDGFWEAVDEETMESTLLRSTLPELWLRSMLESIAQPEAQGQDNLSALAIWLGEQEAITRVVVQGA